MTSWWHRLRARVLFGARLRGSSARVRVLSARGAWSLRLLVREAAAFTLLPLHLTRSRDG